MHEVVVLKTDTPAGKLKVGANHEVSEDASVGEDSETDPAKTKTHHDRSAAGQLRPGVQYRAALREGHVRGLDGHLSSRGRGGTVAGELRVDAQLAESGRDHRVHWWRSVSRYWSSSPT